MVNPVSTKLKRLIELIDLPSEVILELPQIAILGNLEATVANHTGIQKYTPEQICLRIKGGVISIHGQKLTIKRIEKSYIKVAGIIREVQYG